MADPIKIVDPSETARGIAPAFPGNSHRERSQKIAQGNVKVRKRSFGRAVAESFVGDERKNVGEYIIFDVLIPAAKVALIDGLEMFLGIDNRSRRDRPIDRGVQQKPRVMYGNYFDGRRDPGNRDDRRSDRVSRVRSSDVEEVVFDTRHDAIAVLSHMIDIIEEYRSATVADFYGAVGIKSDYVEEDRGWTNLRDALVVPVRSGFIIDMPRPIQLN